MKENSIEEDIKILKELGQKYYKNGEIKIKMIKVYSTESCPWCVKAKQYLKSEAF